MKMPLDAKIFVAGHRGLVGSAIKRALEKDGYANVIVRTRAELDLTDARETARFFEEEKPGFVFLAAALVGGIMANKTRPAEFIHQNLQVQDNVIHSSYVSGVKKLLFLGSSCIYPRLAPQPIHESSLLTGPLEPTNKAYALAKIAGIIQCQSYNEQYGTNFISVMPTNLYGPGDNFDLESSHVLPALISRFHTAKKEGAPSVTLWGTGTPRREFLHVDDLAQATVHLMNTYDESDIVNIGTGEDIEIRELARIIAETVGYEGEIVWDTEKPDGTPRKLLDVSRLNELGWKHSIDLEQGVRDTYDWFVANH